MNSIGWRNEANPNGFLAARGIIPGKEGRFISDSTEPYTVNIPFDFVEIATRLKQDPVDILKNFIADVCQLHSTDELPRADGFNSRGMEAEKKAREYLKQAYRLKKTSSDSTECRTVLCPANRDNPFARPFLFAIHPENENRHSFVQHRLFFTENFLLHRFRLNQKKLSDVS